MTTTPDALPFPAVSDTPDVPRDVRLLAEATQSALVRRSNAATGALAAWTLSTTDSPLADVLPAGQDGRLIAVDLFSLRFDPAGSPAPAFPLSATFTLKQGSTVIARTTVHMWSSAAMIPSIHLAGLMAGTAKVQLWAASAGGNLNTSTNGGLARFVTAVL
jgi:hypothetical protein